MTLKKQSIRKNMHIIANGETISKEELITMSELWSEKQEKAFKKFLKQGVFRFKINNVTFQIDLDSPLRDSQGKKPGPVIKIPGDTRFQMKIKISNGELLDRISILELKKLRVEDSAKLAVVEREFLELNPKCVSLFTKNDSSLQMLYLNLARINGMLWDLENIVRNKKIKDKEFIKASRKIFELNEERNNLKNDINLVTGSDYLDVKEYEL